MKWKRKLDIHRPYQIKLPQKILNVKSSDTFHISDLSCCLFRKLNWKVLFRILKTQWSENWILTQIVFHNKCGTFFTFSNLPIQPTGSSSFKPPYVINVPFILNQFSLVIFKQNQVGFYNSEISRHVVPQWET